MHWCVALNFFFLSLLYFAFLYLYFCFCIFMHWQGGAVHWCVALNFWQRKSSPLSTLLRQGILSPSTFVSFFLLLFLFSHHFLKSFNTSSAGQPFRPTKGNKGAFAYPMQYIRYAKASLIDLVIDINVKGILHQNNFCRLNLIFWIVMWCGVAHFAQRGLKTT